MNEIFQENNIHLIGRISKKSLTEYICSDENHVVCRGMSLELWVRKMIYSNENKLKRIISLLPPDYKSRLIEVAEGIPESIKSATPKKIAWDYGSLVKKDPVDYFLDVMNAVQI